MDRSRVNCKVNNLFHKQSYMFCDMHVWTIFFTNKATCFKDCCGFLPASHKLSELCGDLGVGKVWFGFRKVWNFSSSSEPYFQKSFCYLGVWETECISLFYWIFGGSVCWFLNAMCVQGEEVEYTCLEFHFICHNNEG